MEKGLIMQLSYENNPAAALAGMIANPLDPSNRMVSRIAEADIAFGLCVQAGTDASKEAAVCATEDAFIGMAVMSDNVVNVPTGTVTAGVGQTTPDGEIVTEAKYKQHAQLPVMQTGVCFGLAGTDLSSLAVGDEVMSDANGKLVVAASPTAKYRMFIEEVVAAAAVDTLVKVRISGPQGA